jgi:hypothetical protein
VRPAATTSREGLMARRGWILPFHGLESGRATKEVWDQARSVNVL